MAETLHIRTVTIDDAELPGHVHGGVLVPPGADRWLVHLATTRTVPLLIGTTYSLRITTREGETIEGAAVLRRSDGQAHYFVGDVLPPALEG